MSKIVKYPGPEHPISIEKELSHITVSIAGRIIADTRAALTLRENSYPPVYYIPQGDIDMVLLSHSEHQTYCPYKGDCSYYSIPLGGERALNAAWTFENPHDAVALIKDHIAFYPDLVDEINVDRIP